LEDQEKCIFKPRHPSCKRGQCKNYRLFNHSKSVKLPPNRIERKKDHTMIPPACYGAIEKKRLKLLLVSTYERACFVCKSHCATHTSARAPSFSANGKVALAHLCKQKGNDGFGTPIKIQSFHKGA
jgi:hypothetical protein